MYNFIWKDFNYTSPIKYNCCKYTCNVYKLQLLKTNLLKILMFYVLIFTEVRVHNYYEIQCDSAL